MPVKRKISRNDRNGRKLCRRAPRVPRSLRPVGVFSLSRTVWQTTWVPGTAATTDFWRFLTFSMGSLGWATQLAEVFDQYKVNALKFTLRPRYDNFSGNDSTDTTLPGVTNHGLVNVHVIPDPFSVSQPTGVYTAANMNSFLENGAVKSHQGTKPVEIYIKNPSFNETLSTGITTKSRSRWCNWANGGQSIAYGGAHVFLQDNNFAGNFAQSFDVFATVYLQCKGVV